LFDVSSFSISSSSDDVFRNGRLPTKLLTNEYQEKQKQRVKPVRQQKLTQEELEKSRTRPEEVIDAVDKC
jgi:hypothetical protein